MEHDVFISYSTKDKPVADAVVSALEKQNIRCWYAPRDVEPGTDWGESITRAMHNCQVVLLIFSGNSNQSKRVLDEIYYAISEEKPILPFRIENLDPTGAMRLHLSARHWLDAYQPSWETYINKLVRSVGVMLEREVSLQSTQLVEDQLTGRSKKKSNVWIWAVPVVIVLIFALGGFGLWQLLRGDKGEQIPTETAMQEVAVTKTAAPEAVVAQETATESPPAEEVSAPVSPDAAAEVVLDGYLLEDDLYLNPQIYINESSLTLNKNIYVNLTDYDLARGEIVPEAAESWTVSPDGKTYTFKIRSDIPWVVHPLGGETAQSVDANGTPRFLTAQDFVYGIRQVCDPNRYTGGFEIYYVNVIQGCSDVFNYQDPENIPESLIEEIGVQAVTDDELLIELNWPSSYFLTMSSMHVFAAAPQWAVEKYGSAWLNPGNIVTNGRYVIDEWVPGEQIKLMRNTLLPEDMGGPGNIDVIHLGIYSDAEETYDLWLKDQLDFSLVPADEILTHRVSYARETTQVFRPAVSFVMFQLQKPTFDDVHLRRAFSAAFDRNFFINEIESGQGLPMQHFAVPGVFAAPEIDEIGVGFNLSYARSEMETAGYPDCQGLSPVTFAVYQVLPYYPEIEMVLRDWEENLNCPEGTISLLPAYIGGGQDETEPDMVMARWTSDYPDEHNWVGSLTCGAPMLILDRTCNEIDDLIWQASEETDVDSRIEMYRQVEEALFGEQGEHPVIPVHWYSEFSADHTWLERTQTTYGETFYQWTIDMEAKQTARGE